MAPSHTPRHLPPSPTPQVSSSILPDTPLPPSPLHHSTHSLSPLPLSISLPIPSPPPHHLQFTYDRTFGNKRHFAKIGIMVEPMEGGVTNEFESVEGLTYVQHLNATTGAPVMALASAAVLNAVQQVAWGCDVCMRPVPASHLHHHPRRPCSVLFFFTGTMWTCALSLARCWPCVAGGINRLLQGRPAGIPTCWRPNGPCPLVVRVPRCA
jgi:hypothetical protein